MNKNGLADTVFKTPLSAVPPFSFNEEVAAAFDDMAERSIPFYAEVQRLIVDLAKRYAKAGTTIYDLGCSTGTTMALLASSLGADGPEELLLRGVDASAAMCRRAREKMQKIEEMSGKRGTEDANDGASNFTAYDIRQSDILDEEIMNTSVVIMNYTLQFVPPQNRLSLVRRIHDGLLPGGALIVSDKMLQSSTNVSRVFVDLYYDLKRAHGYSELEIAQKREALENVLIPYRVEEERELLEGAGFSSVDAFFTWCNFSSFICVKDELS